MGYHVVVTMVCLSKVTTSDLFLYGLYLVKQSILTLTNTRKLVTPSSNILVQLWLVLAKSCLSLTLLYISSKIFIFCFMLFSSDEA
jgi:hypothetical protein